MFHEYLLFSQGQSGIGRHCRALLSSGRKGGGNRTVGRIVHGEIDNRVGVGVGHRDRGVHRGPTPEPSIGLACTYTCMYTCIMATKTISVDLEAYERLRAARRSPEESFSQVIKRAHWRNDAATAAGLLEALTDLPTVDDTVLGYLDNAQRADEPPEDVWRSD